MTMPNSNTAPHPSPSNDTGTRKKAIAVIVIFVSALILGGAAWYYLIPPSNPSSEWMLLVDGAVQQPLNLSLDEIAAMPRTTVNAKIYCLPTPVSAGVLVTEGNWTGVRLGFILEKTGVSPEAVKVAFYATDGFTTDLTVTTAMREDIIVAYEKDGEPLPKKLRLVTPGMWGYKWIFLLNHIKLVNYDFKGTHESRGYPDEALIPEEH